LRTIHVDSVKVAGVGPLAKKGGVTQKEEKKKRKFSSVNSGEEASKDRGYGKTNSRGGS